MSDRQKEILEILKEILPQMPDDAQSYLLGYGEGMADALKVKAADALLPDKFFLLR